MKNTGLQLLFLTSVYSGLTSIVFHHNCSDTVGGGSSQSEASSSQKINK